MKQPNITDMMLQIIRGSTEEEILAMYLRLSEALFRSMQDANNNSLGDTMVIGSERDEGRVSIEVTVKVKEAKNNE